MSFISFDKSLKFSVASFEPIPNFLSNAWVFINQSWKPVVCPNVANLKNKSIGVLKASTIPVAIIPTTLPSFIKSLIKV